MEIFKFGEESFGGADSVRRAAALVKGVAPRVAVVISSGAEPTQLLKEAVRHALDGNEQQASDAIHLFVHQHSQLVRELMASRAVCESLISALDEDARALVAICQSIRILRELTPRTMDAVLVRGESATARTFAAFLVSQGVDAQYVDASQLLHTQVRAGVLWPDLQRSSPSAATLLKPILSRQVVPVLSGGIGDGSVGEVVTLGRGGPDLTATLLARLLEATSVTLYKEVDGVMTADPARVPDARVVPELHYREATELAYYGTAVLHPRTLVPLADTKTPVYIRSLFNPDFSGTRVAADVRPGTYPVKALSAFPGQALISIEGSGMIGVPGIAGRAFTALAAAGHSVSMISQASSESSICFVVPMGEARHAAAALEQTFAMELKDRLIDSVRIKQKVALIAVVGLGMRGTPGIAARIFSALSRQKINIVAIAQGSSELNITIALEEEEVAAALNAIHSEYQLHRLRPLPDTEGRESELVLLGFGQIGRALAHQLTSQMRHFQHDLGLNLKTIALIDRSGIQLDERGYSAESLADLARAKASGAKTVGQDASTALQRSFDLVKERIFQLPLHHPILADVTAEETAPFLLEALRQGFHLVLANKKPLAVPQPQFDALIDAARRQGLSLRYEATVGAGLPVLDTLAKLKEAGDDVQRIQGCLSGTLGYLMTQLEEGVAFSAAVAQAHSLGYTEPDPRDDLSGMDVARKALILARTLGYKMELSDIQIQPLFSTQVSHADPAQFIRNLEKLDAEYAAQQKSARGSGQTLRYVAEVTPGAIRVGLEPVPEQSPLARLRGTDNQIVIYTKRYSVNPLVVTGPGAGAEVTAAGVLNDILAIAAGRDRRPAKDRTTSARPTAASTPSGGRS